MGILPLEGYRVIDFGWAAAAPRSTCLLADMGAEVIKVETRKRPDPVRFGPCIFRDSAGRWPHEALAGRGCGYSGYVPL